MDAPWTQSPQEVLQHYTVDPVRGLTSDLAAKHAELYGKNGENSCIVKVIINVLIHSHQNSPRSPPRLYGK